MNLFYAGLYKIYIMLYNIIFIYIYYIITREPALLTCLMETEPCFCWGLSAAGWDSVLSFCCCCLCLSNSR